MDVNVASLAATLVNAKTATAMQDAQVGLLKKTIDAQANIATKMIDSMMLPLATEGRVGTNVNLYA